jgi:hypothetical protein
MSNVLGLVIGFGIRTALWLRRSREAIGEEDDEKIWIKHYVFFISKFFMYNLGMYCAKI